VQIVQLLTARKQFRLNSFNIKRFAYPYCLQVLFSRMRCHCFKRDMEALILWHAADSCDAYFAAQSGKKTLS